jgi:hypothetical protein
MKKEKTKSDREKNTLNEMSSVQLPDDHTSFSVPMKKVKMKVPVRIPNPVPRR